MLTLPLPFLTLFGPTASGKPSTSFRWVRSGIETLTLCSPMKLGVLLTLRQYVAASRSSV